MEAFFSWVAAAFGTLFVVAVAVAWWEHLLQSVSPPLPAEAAPPRRVQVDVALDPTDAGPPGADAAQRRAALDGAMTRMARPGQPPGPWTETSPMVLHPTTTEKAHAGGDAPPPPAG